MRWVWMSICVLTCIESDILYICFCWMEFSSTFWLLVQTRRVIYRCICVCCQSNATWLLPKGHGTACVLLILCYLRRASCALEEDWWLAVWCRMFTVIAVSEVSMSDLCLLNTGSPFYTFRCWLLFAFGVFDFAQVGGHVAVWRAPWVTSVQQGIVFTWVDTKYIWLIYIEMEEVEEAGKFHNFILTTLRHKWETLYFKNVKLKKKNLSKNIPSQF